MNEGRRESAGPAGPDRWSRVDSVVRQALTLAPPDRAAFVERACRGDPALRHDVTSLLEHEAAAESFLAAPAVADAGSAMLGRQLGPYRIDAWLGAGGMGEVYRARDTVLDRDVAVKVLLPATLDPDGLARLKREARTLAALNHPHIAAIYGIEESDASTGPSDAGIRALILELLDGETLAERIARGPLPCRDALHHAAQIADALAAAHDKGIVHRDLKPGNIQVTASGSVKVFDFGIAKTPAGAAAGSTVVTREGSVIGTAAYMSPEQVRAEPIDRQTDVWAFGCVLFEMLAGKPAFDGATTSDTIAAVLEHEPSWSALPAATPDGVRSLLRRCLRKDKAGRQRELSDARLELEEAATAAAAARWRPTIAQRATAAVVLIGVSAGALGIDWIDSASVAPIDPLARKHTIVVPPAARLALGIAAQEAGQPNIAVSEDGSHVVYVAVKGGVPQLYLQSSEAFAPTALAGTDGAYAPFFSPDGKWIAFFAGTKLKKVFIRGGEPHIVCDSRRSRGGTWADDGTIYFAAHEGSALLRVSSEGGAAPTPVASGRRQFMWPSALPGGRALLFTSFVARQPHVEVIDVTTGVRKVLLHRATSARYARTGHIVYM